MRKTDILYCVNSKDCPKGQTCIRGNCVPDITPDPPKTETDQPDED